MDVSVSAFSVCRRRACEFMYASVQDSPREEEADVVFPEKWGSASYEGWGSASSNVHAWSAKALEAYGSGSLPVQGSTQPAPQLASSGPSVVSSQATAREAQVQSPQAPRAGPGLALFGAEVRKPLDFGQLGPTTQPTSSALHLVAATDSSPDLAAARQDSSPPLPHAATGTEAGDTETGVGDGHRMDGERETDKERESRRARARARAIALERERESRRRDRRDRGEPTPSESSQKADV